MDANEFADNLRNMPDLSGTHQVSASELLNDRFMAENTNLATLNDLLNVCGLQNSKDFADNPPSDEIMALHTHFATWSEMISAAGKELVRIRAKEAIRKQLRGQ